MNDIEAKALALVNDVLRETEGANEPYPIAHDYMRALCRAIEQHEAFKQEVSDKVEKVIESCAVTSWGAAMLDLLIIPKPKPDPLYECLEEALARNGEDLTEHTDRLRAALEARGLEIREKGQ